MLPVHTWLPDAASEATPATSVLLVGVLDKVGTFGMIRLCLPLFPDAAKWATPMVIVLRGHLDHLRRAAGHRADRHHAADRLHLGEPLRLHRARHLRDDQLGPERRRRSTWSTTASRPRRMFLIAAMLVKRRGSRRIADFGGWQRLTPLLAGTFLVAGLSSLALPGLSTLRQRVPGAGRDVLALQGGGRLRGDRHRAGRALHPADVPADDDRAQARGRVRGPDAGHAAPRGVGGRADHRDPARARLLPEAGARRHLARRSTRTMQQVGVTDPAPTNAVPAAEGTSK